MLKKKAKKLTLSKESLVRLDQWQLREVAAGAATSPAATCVHSDNTHCTQCSCNTCFC